MDSKQISKSKFKAKALEFFRYIETSGEPLVVTDHGKPALEVRLYRAPYNIESNPLRALKRSVMRYDHPTDPIAEEDWAATQ